MRYLKMLGLAAVAAAALTAFVGAGTAPANTVLCHTTVTTGCASAGWDWSVGAELDLSLKAGTTARTIDTSGFVTLGTCTKGSINGTLSTTTTPTITLEPAETWPTCYPTITGGEISIHHIAGTHNGTVVAKGFGWTMTFPQKSCVFGFAAERDIGTLVPSANGEDAQLNMNVAADLIPKHSYEGCPSSIKWIATFTQTSSAPLHVTES